MQVVIDEYTDELLDPELVRRGKKEELHRFRSEEFSGDPERRSRGSLPRGGSGAIQAIMYLRAFAVAWRARRLSRISRKISSRRRPPEGPGFNK